VQQCRTEELLSLTSRRVVIPNKEKKVADVVVVDDDDDEYDHGDRKEPTLL